MITRKELIKKYLEFFKSKGHAVIPSASLVPANDPTVLFTTAGMHPLVPYLLGQKHPLGKRLANVQRCIRTTDIDEVGDKTHGTFFEMLGNWGLGDYWKKEAIEWSYEFLTKVLKLDKDKLAVTCFAGDEDAPRDDESAKVWLALGIPRERITFLPKKDNWWGPAGETGPCGPDTEIFYWTGKGKVPEKYDTKNKRWVEIGNDVFMQYNKTKDRKYVELKQKNVDFGGGLDRQLAILNDIDDIFKTEIYWPIIQEIEEISGKKYKGNEKAMRIIADHIKAAVFIISDGVQPSNKDRGSILRRLIRRAVWYGKDIGLGHLSKIAEPIFKIYDGYPELKKNKKTILKEIKIEEDKFNSTIKDAIKKLRYLTKDNPKKVSPKDMFLLFQSFGMPKELIKEELNKLNISFPEQEFQKELETHIRLSGSAILGRFKSGLADSSEKTIRLHTATHLLNEALRRVLGPEVKQRGSNITPERLRFDFSFPRKLTGDEIAKVENLVNENISESIPVRREEISLKMALKSGAQSEFGSKYPEIVSVYSIGNFSKEICTGPHVKNTREIGKFKITKEESIASGIRRIKAVVL